MAEQEEVVEPLHLELEDREVYLAKIPVRLHLLHVLSALLAAFVAGFAHSFALKLTVPLACIAG